MIQAMVRIKQITTNRISRTRARINRYHSNGEIIVPCQLSRNVLNYALMVQKGICYFSDTIKPQGQYDMHSVVNHNISSSKWKYSKLLLYRACIFSSTTSCAEFGF